jgi:hypothetical protein
MLTNKGRNSDSAADKANLDITAPRQTEKIATELCSFAIIWWSFLGLLRFFKVDGTYGPEGGVSRRMVRTQLNHVIRCHNWISGQPPIHLMDYRFQHIFYSFVLLA